MKRIIKDDNLEFCPGYMIRSTVGMEELCRAIIRQAAVDYIELKNKKVKSIISRHGNRSVMEIGRFFNGQWCKEILQGLGIKKYNGNDLFKIIKDSVE